MKIKLKQIIGVTLSIIMMLSVMTGCAGSKKRVVIYTSMEDYRNEELTKQLKSKFPDIETVVQYIPTGNNAAKIKAEGTKTEADIVVGLDTTAFIKIADNFADLKSYSKDMYIDGINDADDRYLTWEKYEGAIVVNTKVLEEKGLAQPKTYADLLKPEYKGLIAMPNPKTSGTAYMFLNSWVKTMGEDKAFEYVDQLQKNIKQFTETGSAPVKMLVQGEIGIGVGLIAQATDQISKGAPLKILTPEFGCPYSTSSFGMIKGKETNKNVKAVFDFLYNDFIIYDKENFCPGKILKKQDVKLKNYPAELKSADMSTITNADLKVKLVGRWKY